MKVTEKLSKLRELMKKHHMDVYIIPTSDFHETEYVGEYFKARRYMSGFNGSAGTLVVTLEEAGLWTDGRYFIQAENQLRDTGIALMKMGIESTPSINDYVSAHVKDMGRVGFDGRVMNTQMVLDLQETLKKKQATIVTGYDLVGEIWHDRPAVSYTHLKIKKRKALRRKK